MLKDILSELNINRARAVAAAAKAREIAAYDDVYYVLSKEAAAINYSLGELSPGEAAPARKKLAGIKRKQAARLKELGISAEPIFACTACGDTGYKGGVLCPCVKKLLAEVINRSSGLGVSADFAHTDFSRFGENSEYMLKLYHKMRDYCAAFPSDKRNTIVLFGGTGTGKTHLAACIAREVSLRGFGVVFVSAFKLNSIMLKIHTAPVEQKAGLLDSLLESDLLIIDDLGAEQIYKNVTLEYLTSIFDERKIARKNTLFTTNLSPDAILVRYGERFFSRLYDKSSSYSVEHKGRDSRIN